MSRPDSTFKIGSVTERDPATARVRVVFPDYDNLPSWWLPVLHQKTKLDQDYWLPDIGEFVACLVDQHAESGVVIGAIYTDILVPPTDNGAKRLVKFGDGTEVEYDRELHKLRVSLVAEDAEVEVATTGHISIASAAGDIRVLVAEGQNVFVGDDDSAIELATRDFVEQIFLTHTHPTPAGISAAPVPIGTELQWPNVTERLVAR